VALGLVVVAYLEAAFPVVAYLEELDPLRRAPLRLDLVA